MNKGRAASFSIIHHLPDVPKDTFNRKTLIKKETMEVKPEIGIGELTFGMKRAQVEKILGKPDIEKTDQDHENKLILVFNSTKFRLTYYKNEDNRLGYIETSNPEISFNGIPILGTPIDIAENEVFGEFIEEWTLEEYHTFSTHFNERYWLTLHSEFEVVTQLELGVPFENDEAYKWPS